MLSDFRDVLTSDGKVLFCQTCGKSIVTQQRSQVTQHLNGSKHIAAIAQSEQKDRPGKRSLIGESFATSSHSGPSEFATFVTSVQSICVCSHTPF
jgi:hypothetical protein